MARRAPDIGLKSGARDFAALRIEGGNIRAEMRHLRQRRGYAA